MDLDPGLLADAVVSGLLLGCLYMAASIGLAISFGMLDIVNIAHPAVMVLGSFATVVLCNATGLDPLLACVLLTPLFWGGGWLLYSAYWRFFERRGDQAIQGLAFFFGIMFVIEVGLVMSFGPDQRFVNVPYAAASVDVGPFNLPFRMLLPAGGSLLAVAGLLVFLRYSFTGRAVSAVAQDGDALRFLAINPVRVKRLAFGLSTAFACLAGGALVVVQPVEPASGQVFIGRVFAAVILGGLGSLPGCVVAALAFGVVENVTATLFGPSWSPAVAFGLLLLILAVRPQGLFGAAA